MKRRVVALTISLSMLISLLCSCSFLKKEEKRVREYFGYFDTFSSLTSYTYDAELFDNAADALDKLLSEYNQLFDIYHSYDGIVNLKSLNENAAKGAITLDSKLIAALDFGKEMHTLTNGHVNIALGSVISLWHDAREYSKDFPDAAYVPDTQAINEALLHTDINNLIIDLDANTAEITDEALSLDLGAIAKGYVAERARELLLSMGLDSFLLNLGGNVLACGKKPDGSQWSSLIENPFEDGKGGYNGAIPISERSLVTSGSYQRFYAVDGKEYSHIISKDDGMPPEHFVSVSVISRAEDSGVADALSTALYCMPLEEGKAFALKLDVINVIWILPDRSVVSASILGGTK